MKASLKVAGIALICFSLTVCLCDNSAKVSGTIPEARAAGGAAYTPYTPHTPYTPNTPYTLQTPPWNVSETQPSASGISIISSVDLLTDAEINGSRQKLLIRADDTDNPILLFIHGGPGDSAMMLSHAYSDLLRSRFIFVNWDQRGSGLSWHEDMDESKINEDQLVDDALELTRYLTETYKKDKIYIIGHSYGSIIGMRLAAEHPELYYAYIGMGQVLDWNKSVACTKKWLAAEMRKAGDESGLNKLKSSSVPDMDEVVKYGGHTHKLIDFNEIIMNSPYYFDGYIDMKNRAREFVQRNIAKSKSTLSFWNIDNFDIPIFFFEGRFDHVTACAPELVIQFCDKTEAPVKEIVWFEESAHMPNLEEPVKFQQMVIEKLLM